MSAFLAYLKQWWAERLHPCPTLEAPAPAPYPRVIVEWGEADAVSSDEERWASRDCGHVSRSYAYDPLRETSACLDCYRRSIERKGAR